MPVIGTSVRRLEDEALLRGQGRFAADISFPGQIHMRVIRSTVAHGRLIEIETMTAASMPGVVAVWTGSDVADVPPIDFRLVGKESLTPFRQPILAQQRVRYVGEPLAVVFAHDPYLAEDAAERVYSEIDELAPCLDPTGDPGWFDDQLTSEAAELIKAYGDVEEAFARAEHMIELVLRIGRHSGSPIETRGALAHREPDGTLVIYGAAKVPHINRKNLAKQLGLPLDALHLREGHVGGGFGIRGEIYPEDVLVALAALRLNRPVKWIEDRREHLIAANHSRDQLHHIRAAIDERGFILGIDDEFWSDQGAYVRTHAATVPDLTCAMLPGPYVVPAYRVRAHIRLTNKTPCGTYRAPGRYEGTFVRERLMDEIARRVGSDRITVRRINLVAPSAMPFNRGLDALGTHVVYDSGDYPMLLDKLLALARHGEVKTEIAARRARGELVGFGLGFFIEKSGLGPFDGVRICLQADGIVEIVTGAASLGQGIETVIAQICADVLTLPMRCFRVIHGQTDRISDGMGAFASRVTVMTGSAAHMAATDFRGKLLAAAATVLQTDIGHLAMRDTTIGARDGRGPSIGLEALAALADGIEAEAWFNASHMCYPYGIHAAVVGIDAETGAVKVEKLFLAYDIGRAVNPTLVEGQLVGGAAQGLGGALLEEFVFDAAGQPLAASFADYLMPTAREMPSFTVHLTEDAPSPINPLGVKGAGEGGITAVGAAIANAIDDALGRPGAGVVDRVPMSPQRVRAIVKQLRCGEPQI